MLASLLTLTACQDQSSQSELIPKTSQEKNPKENQGNDKKTTTETINTEQGNYCQLKTTPFSYYICQVSQKKLLNSSKNNANHNVKKNTHNNANLSLQLFWRVGNDNTNKAVKPLYTFDRLLNQLGKESKLIFAVNAGMYNDDYAPIGYTVINKQQVLSLNLNEGAGNFHLMPNGVFWWNEDGYHINDSKQMAKLIKSGTKPTYATQSGPMLVIDGKIHPKFRSDGKSRKIRNGVGVCKDGNIKLVNSNTAVNFYDFASLFKNQLACDNALFLDGGIAPAMYAPEINHKDSKAMGVMIGLVELDWILNTP